MREQLKQHVDVLEERLKKISGRLYVDRDLGKVKFEEVFGYAIRTSVRYIYCDDVELVSQGCVSDREWQSIPHNLVLEIVEEWQKEFLSDIPKLKLGQLRLNGEGHLCLLVSYNNTDKDIRAWNLIKHEYEVVNGSVYTDYRGNNLSWKEHLPKVVIEDVSKLQGVAQVLQI